MYESNENLNILSINQPISLNLGNDSSLPWTSYNQTEPVEFALNTVSTNLADFFNSPHFEVDMQTAFGSQWQLDRGTSIVEALAAGENLPVITVLPPDLMNGVNGGFDSLTGSIYLNQTLINNHSALVDVLTEELGHHIDSLLNPTDTPGDEGELFSRLVRGETLTKQQVAQLQQESDRSFIFDGLVEVEASGKASFSKAKNFDVESNQFESPGAVAVADFNSDGISDLALANEGFSSGSVSILLGNGDGSFTNGNNFPTDSLSLAVAAANFNADDLSDLVVVNGNSDNVSILLGKGNGNFSKATNFAVGNNPTSVAVTDFNDDGISDLAVANSNNVSILLGKGNGKFSKATNFAVVTSPNSVAAADFNGDGNSDLAVANSSNISILLGKGNGKFSKATNFEGGGESLAVSDFNGDGISDLAVAAGSYFSGSVSVLLGKGDGSFGKATSFDTKRTGSISVAVADFNGDGTSDLAVANESYFNSQLSSVSVLLGKGNGSFGKATNFAVGQWPLSVAVGDFNGDAIPDLTLANSSDTVSILLNTTKTATTNPPNITISNTKITEGNTGRKNAKFTVNLDGESDETVTVNYATANGSAKAGKDYRKTTGTLTFKPGQLQKTITVPILGDTLDEANEKFTVNLSKPQNAKLSKKRGTGRIRDND